MIGLIFSSGSEVIEVRINDGQILFRNKESYQFTDIKGIKLKKSGVIKEHPDLKDDEDWQNKARERFKTKVKEMKSEKEQSKYIITELTKLGYKPLYLQKQGFRPVKL